MPEGFSHEAYKRIQEGYRSKTWIATSVRSFAGSHLKYGMGSREELLNEALATITPIRTPRPNGKFDVLYPYAESVNKVVERLLKRKIITLEWATKQGYPVKNPGAPIRKNSY